MLRKLFEQDDFSVTWYDIKYPFQKESDSGNEWMHLVSKYVVRYEWLSDGIKGKNESQENISTA